MYRISLFPCAKTHSVIAMRGIVEKIWENRTQNNKRYHVVEIGGEKYSVWDSALMEGITEGARVEYDWKKSGNFKKITGLQKIDESQMSEAYQSDRKSREIIRMSCLRSASELLYGLYFDPDEKAEKALDIARRFERYVSGEDHNQEKTRDA